MDSNRINGFQKGNYKGEMKNVNNNSKLHTKEWVWWESSICSALNAQSSNSFSFLSFCLAAL